MPDFELGARLPAKTDDYRIEAFFDDLTDDDTPDLHIRIGKLRNKGKAAFEYLSVDQEIAIRMDLDWSHDDQREFWNRLKAAADTALARIDAVAGRND